MSTTASVHSVQFYSEDSSLIERLCGIINSGLRIGTSVLIVATAPHREQLVVALDRARIDVRPHVRQGRFAMYDAAETLETFMVDGYPDRDLFMTSVGRMLADAKNTARSRNREITVFGEMVALLWEQGNRDGALQLEALWNDAMNDSAFHLHCAYPRQYFAAHADDQNGLAEVCRTHSHILIQ